MGYQSVLALRLYCVTRDFWHVELYFMWHPPADVSTLKQHTTLDVSLTQWRFHMNLTLKILYGACISSVYIFQILAPKMNHPFNSLSHRHAGGQCYLEKQDVCGHLVGLHTTWLGSPQVRSIIWFQLDFFFLPFLFVFVFFFDRSVDDPPLAFSTTFIGFARAEKCKPLLPRPVLGFPPLCERLYKNARI